MNLFRSCAFFAAALAASSQGVLAIPTSDEDFNQEDVEGRSFNGYRPIQNNVAGFRDGQDDFDLNDPESTVTFPDPEGNVNVLCMLKVMMVEETLYDEEQRCNHVYTQECHDTYVTEMGTSLQEKCEETFKKSCYIDFVDTPRTHEVEECNTNLKRDCDQPGGEEICTDEHETVCDTTYMQGTVEEHVPVCNTVKTEVCSPEDSDNCKEVRAQKCEIMKMESRKVMPMTNCRQVTKKVCGPEKCPIVPSEPICHKVTKTVVVSEPKEDCHMTPEKSCRKEQVQVPKLVAREECIEVPKEVCSMARVNPRKQRTPTKKTWCGPKELVQGAPAFRQFSGRASRASRMNL